MTHPPLFKLSELLIECQNNTDIPHNFMSDKLTQIITMVESLEHSIGHEISPLFEYHRSLRNTILQKEGELTTHLWIIEKGSARSYASGAKHENTCDFHFPGEFTGRLSEYKLQVKSQVTIKAITPLSCWSIHCDDVEYMKKKCEAAADIIELLNYCKIKWQYLLIQYRQQLSAANYYELLLEKYPSYFQHIPLNYIASYLNVSPTSLSRIRARFNNK